MRRSTRGFTVLEVMIAIAVMVAMASFLLATYGPAHRSVDDQTVARDLIALRDVLREQMREDLVTTDLLNTNNLITRGLIPAKFIDWDNRTLRMPWADTLTLNQVLAPGDSVGVLTESLALTIGLSRVPVNERVGLCMRLAKRLSSEFNAMTIGTTTIRQVTAGARDAAFTDETVRINTACASGTTMRTWL